MKIPYVLSSEDCSFERISSALELLREELQKGNFLGVQAQLFCIFAELPFLRKRVVFGGRSAYFAGSDCVSGNALCRKNYFGGTQPPCGDEQISFYRGIQAFCGMPPMKYLLNVRLKQAYGKLSAGCSVTESALESGFNNLSYFTRQFRKNTGFSERGKIWNKKRALNEADGEFQK